MDNPALTNVAALVGRILVAAIFLISGFGKIGGFEGVVGYIGSKGLPMPEVLAAATCSCSATRCAGSRSCSSYG